MPSISPSQPSCFGTGPAGQEIGLDLVEARQHLGVDVEHGTSQTGVFMLARGAVGSGAPAQLDLSVVEVLFKPAPLGVSDRAVLVGGAGLAAPVEKALIVADDVLVEHGDVATSCLQIQVAE